MFTSVLDTGKRGRSRLLSLGSGLTGAVLTLVEVAAITGVSTITGTIWHQFAYGNAGEVQSFIDVGVLTGMLYTLPFLFGTDYRADNFLAGRRTLSRMLNVWTYAFFALAALAFLTKTTGNASRGGLALYFVVGGLAIVAIDAALRHALKSLVRRGLVAPRRLLVVGAPHCVSKLVSQHSLAETGIEVTATANLPLEDGSENNSPSLDDRLEWALDKARSASVNDVLILLDDNASAGLGARVADRFMDLPVGVHLGQLSIATRFPKLQAARIGKTSTLALRTPPLNPYQQALKRIFDFVLSLVGLMLLAPVFLVVGLLIKLDSPGPVFFRQRRRGFNQREFAIWKFRTMTTMDDGAHIQQAVRNDPRVTRIGRVLRRFNIDEVPQLMNVVLGDMSLVGPRPHAVAHDRHYERVIRHYGRRLNVKPGITGWAQVNGYRGLTETEYAMRSRIAHDLYYIDNWSIALDIYIMVLTVLSPKAFRNAH
ncbi:MAG: exopolysaccharide biosynthesis polyprenyl glycosylphosphotransferase [Hyphomicrobiaceae bacterium]